MWHCGVLQMFQLVLYWWSLKPFPQTEHLSRSLALEFLWLQRRIVAVDAAPLQFLLDWHTSLEIGRLTTRTPVPWTFHCTRNTDVSFLGSAPYLQHSWGEICAPQLQYHSPAWSYEWNAQDLGPLCLGPVENRRSSCLLSKTVGVLETAPETPCR